MMVVGSRFILNVWPNTRLNLSRYFNWWIWYLLIKWMWVLSSTR